MDFWRLRKWTTILKPGCINILSQNKEIEWTASYESYTIQIIRHYMLHRNTQHTLQILTHLWISNRSVQWGEKWKSSQWKFRHQKYSTDVLQIFGVIYGFNISHMYTYDCIFFCNLPPDSTLCAHSVQGSSVLVCFFFFLICFTNILQLSKTAITEHWNTTAKIR